jgi:DASS family divalent anion:Na+ symporter
LPNSSTPRRSLPADLPATTSTVRAAWLRWAPVLLIPTLILISPSPDGVSPQAWRLLAIFAGTIAGLMAQPLPLGAMALLGVAAAALSGAMTAGQALAGYAEPLVWMVLGAFGISRGMIKTGLGRRIALLFVRAMGRTSIGLGYAIVASDTVLGMVIPSNGARAGGIVFPVVKSLAETYESRPGPTAARLGMFLVLMVYHCDIIVSALFFTGNAANPLIASLAKQVTGIEIGYGRWALGAALPAAVSMIVLPVFLYRRRGPEVKQTPGAAEFGRAQLEALGPMVRAEKVMLAVFALITFLWLTTGWHHIDFGITALAGLAALLVGGVLTWDDVLSERGGWDVLVWYGAIFQMARVLGDAGLTRAFAQAAGHVTAGAPWPAALVALLFIYLYSHYAFATITARVSALYAAILIVILAAGTPPYLAVFAMSYVSSLGAALTHYGTTTSPIYYGAGYTTPAGWWRDGLLLATLNTVVWLAVGAVWWKLLGWW